MAALAALAALAPLAPLDAAARLAGTHRAPRSDGAGPRRQRRSSLVTGCHRHGANRSRCEPEPGAGRRRSCPSGKGRCPLPGGPAMRGGARSPRQPLPRAGPCRSRRISHHPTVSSGLPPGRRTFFESRDPLSLESDPRSTAYPPIDGASLYILHGLRALVHVGPASPPAGRCCRAKCGAAPAHTAPATSERLSPDLSCSRRIRTPVSGNSDRL